MISKNAFQLLIEKYGLINSVNPSVSYADSSLEKGAVEYLEKGGKKKKPIQINESVLK